MYLAAYAFLIAALLLALGGASLGVLQLWQGENPDPGRLEKAHFGVTLSLCAASAFLLYSLISRDFSLEYAAHYTDRVLPLFYRVTAFWAGQAGSLLFWALLAAAYGAVFPFTRAYRALSPGTRLRFWIFLLSFMAFFGLLLSTWNNPFILLSPAPGDGQGMNPLLQDPGMIFHPPLLFLGYAGFIIPGCLALAQAMSRAGANGAPLSEISWAEAARPFSLTAWLFLTAGIVLGAWWAYKELGWGGYWAWDPVENASLLPWLLGTAALHAGLLETRRNKLHRAHAFLMALTAVSAFFATYLARGGAANSVHAFGASDTGIILLVFVLYSLLLVLAISLMGKTGNAGAPDSLETREGFIIMAVWLFIALCLIILIGTLWPQISSLWSARPEGLNAGFFNSVCLPLFIVLTALLAFCPWLRWGGGIRNRRCFIGTLGVFVAGLALFWGFGVRDAMPLMAASLCAACLASALMTLADKSVRRQPSSLAACLVHLGLALTALGITFSGPYKQEAEVALARGENAEIGPYSARLTELYEGRDATGAYTFLEAEIALDKNGGPVGTVSPQRRVYRKFGQTSEAATHFSPGSEFYAVLLGLDGGNRAILRISSTPLINWLWIGGTIMSLAPLLGLAARRRRSDPDPEKRRP